MLRSKRSPSRRRGRGSTGHEPLLRPRSRFRRLGVERLEPRCLLSAVAQGPADLAPDGYPRDFSWHRAADWVPGTVQGSTVGNPASDGQGNATWQYAYVAGGDGLGGANPWYKQTGSLLSWDGDWHGEAGRWAKADDTMPAASQWWLEAVASESPVLQWLNPTGQDVALDLGGSLSVFWGEGASGVVQVAVVQVQSSGTLYSELLAESVVGSDGLFQTVPITISQRPLGPDDRILVTARYSGTTGWAALDDSDLWFSLNSYQQDFYQWNRPIDWTPGTTVGSTAGNPDGDHAYGRLTWHYDYVTAANTEGFAAPTPWYRKTSSPLEWDDSFAGLGAAWASNAASDQGPAIFAGRMADLGSLGADRRPVIRWANTTGRRLQLDVLGDLQVKFLNGAGGTAQVVLACKRLTDVEDLFAAILSPDASPACLRVDFQNLIVDPGDEILVSVLWNYGTDTTSGHRVELDDSSLFFRISPFTWERAGDWSGGQQGTTSGNPDDDALGRLAWQYASIGGGNDDGLGTPTPWYAKPSAALVWSDDWRATGEAAWVRGAGNLGPAVFVDRLVHSGEYGERRPLIEWLFPVGATRLLDIYGNLQVSWEGSSGTAAGPVDVALVQQHGDGTFVPLLATTVDSRDGLQQDMAVDLRQLTFEPGDRLLLTARWDYGTDVSAAHWVALYDGLTIKLADAVQISAQTDEDSVLVIEDLAGAGFDPASMHSEEPPRYGSAELQLDGSIVYTPAPGWWGQDTFCYGVADPAVGPLSVRITVDVLPVNDPPLALPDTARTTIGRTINVDVLANDSDADLDLLRIALVALPAHGRAIIESDQSITYIPDAGYQGPDSFSYTVWDGKSRTDPARVDLMVDAPLVFYVSPTGNDALDGLTRATALATLDGARLKARPIVGQAVEVIFEPGTYRLTEPVQFVAQDSGTSDAPIEYRAADLYGQDWIWNRSADWQPGVTTGNPSADAKGRPTWQYGWATGGGGLGSSDPWYAQPLSLMEWDEDFAGQGPSWARSDDTLPAAGEERIEVDATAAALVRWLNPTGHTAYLDVSGSLDCSFSPGAIGDCEVTIVRESVGSDGDVAGRQALAAYRLSSVGDLHEISLALESLSLGPADRVVLAVRYTGTGAVQVDDRALGVRLLAATADAVTFSGSQVVAAAWTEVGTTGMWQAGVQPFLAQFGLASGFNTLFVDGQRAQRAREPDVGYYTIVSVNPLTSLTAFRFTSGNISAAWANLTDVEIVHYQQWQSPRMRIASVNNGTKTVTLAAPLIPGRGYDWDYGGPSAGTSRYYVENFLEGLDTPGEWYLNRHTGVLYYRPLPGQDIHSAMFTAPVTEQLVNLTGTSHVAFSGLEFVQTDWELPSTGYRGFQGAAAEMTTLPAVQASGGQGLAFRDNTFTGIGGYALKVASADAQIVDNRFAGLGAGGILVPVTSLEGHRVARNQVQDFGLVYADAIGIFVERAGRTRILNNEVYGGAYTGIEVGWSWDATATDAHDNLVQENHVHHVMQKLYDGAGIYLNGFQPGSAVQANYVHDVVRTADHYFDNPDFSGLHGLYLDEGSSGIVVRGNVVVRAQSLLKINEPPLPDWQPGARQPNRILSNILLDAQRRVFDFSFMPNEVILSNVCAWTSPPSAAVDLVYNQRAADAYGPYRQDDNLYDLRLATVNRPTSLAAHRAAGSDLHSLVADPGFVDPAAGDYRLRPDSAAIGLGFDAFWLVFGASANLDADGNGTADPLTDGVLILRYLFEPAGAWSVDDALGAGAIRTTRQEIIDYLHGARATVLDADGDGFAEPLSDGILILRYLFDPQGYWNVDDALGLGAVRTTRDDIKAYLDQFNPNPTAAPPGAPNDRHGAQIEPAPTPDVDRARITISQALATGGTGATVGAPDPILGWRGQNKTSAPRPCWISGT